MASQLEKQAIRVGTLVKAEGMADYIGKILPHGFESFSITWWGKVEDDLEKAAAEVKEALGDSGAVISSVACFGNPMGSDDEAAQTREGFEKLIDGAHLFGADIVAGFTGRVPGKSIDENIPRFKEVWAPLAKRAEDKGVRVAFENCPMGGNWADGRWNIAHNPQAWELMFDAVPSDAIGLEWEPCHQMVQLIDPIAQLREWVGKVYHLHGKCATICWDVVRKHGIGGPQRWSYHRTPGFGDCNWSDVITILRLAGFEGAIDIEGWHDPVYRDALEMTGQVHGLNYLKRCRGGDIVENP